jgi:hypothetical protein
MVVSRRELWMQADNTVFFKEYHHTEFQGDVHNDIRMDRKRTQNNDSGFCLNLP